MKQKFNLGQEIKATALFSDIQKVIQDYFDGNRNVDLDSILSVKWEELSGILYEHDAPKYEEMTFARYKELSESFFKAVSPTKE